MSGQRAGEERQPACGMPRPLCLLLLLSAATGALALEGQDGDGGHTQEVAEIKKNSLLTFLAWWYEWTSQARAAPFVGGEAREVSKRQGGPPPQQSTPPEKVPCKNFFWKTFSSCKGECFRLSSNPKQQRCCPACVACCPSFDSENLQCQGPDLFGDRCTRTAFITRIDPCLLRKNYDISTGQKSLPTIHISVLTANCPRL